MSTYTPSSAMAAASRRIDRATRDLAMASMALQEISPRLGSITGEVCQRAEDVGVVVKRAAKTAQEAGV